MLRRLETIGEAVKHISPHIKDSYSNIPWRKIAGIRDVLIHEYFGVKMKRIWKVAQEDLPKLKNDITKIKSELAP